jgi:hypothetical protein
MTQTFWFFFVFFNIYFFVLYFYLVRITETVRMRIKYINAVEKIYTAERCAASKKSLRDYILLIILKS